MPPRRGRVLVRILHGRQVCFARKPTVQVRARPACARRSRLSLTRGRQPARRWQQGDRIAARRVRSAGRARPDRGHPRSGSDLHRDDPGRQLLELRAEAGELGGKSDERHRVQPRRWRRGAIRSGGTVTMTPPCSPESISAAPSLARWRPSTWATGRSTWSGDPRVSGKRGEPSWFTPVRRLPHRLAALPAGCGRAARSPATVDRAGPDP
jgi:hypothetical protein